MLMKQDNPEGGDKDERNNFRQEETMRGRDFSFKEMQVWARKQETTAVQPP